MWYEADDGWAWKEYLGPILFLPLINKNYFPHFKRNKHTLLSSYSSFWCPHNLHSQPSFYKISPASAHQFGFCRHHPLPAFLLRSEMLSRYFPIFILRTSTFSMGQADSFSCALSLPLPTPTSYPSHTCIPGLLSLSISALPTTSVHQRLPDLYLLSPDSTCVFIQLPHRHLHLLAPGAIGPEGNHLIHFS